MFPQIKNWFLSLAGSQPDTAKPRRPNALPTHNRKAARNVPKPLKVPVLNNAHAVDQFELTLDDKTEPLGPGKSVLSSTRLYCIDTGTHENLEIVDDPGGNDEGGIDPYNTGAFKRKVDWDKRFRE